MASERPPRSVHWQLAYIVLSTLTSRVHCGTVWQLRPTGRQKLSRAPRGRPRGLDGEPRGRRHERGYAVRTMVATEKSRLRPLSPPVCQTATAPDLSGKPKHPLFLFMSFYSISIVVPARPTNGLLRRYACQDSHARNYGPSSPQSPLTAQLNVFTLSCAHEC
jgi:hypothetical protein